jgi:hypothetical protein
VLSEFLPASTQRKRPATSRAAVNIFPAHLVTPAVFLSATNNVSLSEKEKNYFADKLSWLSAKIPG